MSSVVGQCFCKKITFEIQFPTEFVSHCHCESCRASHGAAFVTWGGVSKSQFKFLTGEHLLKKYNSSPQVRWCFCSECGTSLLYDCDYVPEKIYFTIANIKDELDRKPDSHMSFEERAHWFPFKDELPKYKEKSNVRIDFNLREALTSEGKYLTDLAARSKAHWPYDDDYLRKAALVTQVTEKDISSWTFKVMELNQTIVGFYGLASVNDENRLDHLWIEPEHIGKGYGRILFEDAIKSAIKMNWSRFIIAADPCAEAFYLKLGAINIGSRESKVKPGFFLPLLEYTISLNFEIENKKSGGSL